MKNTHINRQVVAKVAHEEVIYVGGAVVSFYINDPAADDVRPTKDIDISLSVASIGELENIREQLNEKGFYQSSEIDVICRFKFEDVLVDVMNTTAISWAPGNKWFKKGFDNRIQIKIVDQNIFIMPFTHFLASKFEAFLNRGGRDARMSHDFEDITYLLDNRMDWDVLINSETDEELKEYLTTNLIRIIEKPQLKEAVLGNLYYETAEERLNLICSKIEML